ncbi:MAG: Monoacylglycerol lipase [Anaerolineales bacterium]|nr:Monoacylglycerol lipase [Anaerolineales bacterium]
MSRLELNWKSRDGLDMFAAVWEPNVVAPRAAICLVHGLGEHVLRYEHVAEALGREGFILFGFDLRGHGQSGGERGHLNSGEDYLSDIDLLLEQARARYPGLPIFLYGHSLGGILVLYYGLKRKPALKGVIATSSGLRTALEKQPVKILLAKVLGSLFPKAALPSGLDVNGLSHDPAVVKAYVDDPLVHDRTSLGFGKNMLGVIGWVLTHAGEFPLPLLLMHGKKDEIAYPSGSVEVAAALKERATLVLWEDMLHEIHNELEKAEAFKTMTMWMDARLREG